MPDGNIYIRLEIAKDPITNTLTLITHLNPNAPNITIRENSISWRPTAEEQKFLSQAFQFFSSSKMSTSWSPSQTHFHATSNDMDPHQKIEKILQEKTGIS